MKLRSVVRDASKTVLYLTALVGGSAVLVAASGWLDGNVNPVSWSVAVALALFVVSACGLWSVHEAESEGRAQLERDLADANAVVMEWQREAERLSAKSDAWEAEARKAKKLLAA